MSTKLHLFRVTLRGCAGTITSGYKVSYVVAQNSDLAYRAVRQHLDDIDYGFSRDRELHSVELLAGPHEDANTDIPLFLP